MDFEAKLGDVLVRLKATDFDDLQYKTSSKAVDFEKWVQLTRMNLESRHSQLVLWWGAMLSNAQAAYSTYLQLPPLRRSEVRPTMEGFTATTLQVERYMRRHILRVMPSNVQQTLLHMANVSCSDVLFQALVDAGPGTEQGRAFTLNNVVSKGPAVQVQQIYERLHQWRYNLMRLSTLGGGPTGSERAAQRLDPLCLQDVGRGQRLSLSPQRVPHELQSARRRDTAPSG